MFGIMPREEAQHRQSFIGFPLANNYLKLYEEADVRSSRFDINLNDLMELTWLFVDRIAALKEHKIKCPAVWPAKLGATVDGTQTRANEPRDPDMRRNPKNYACKHNFAGLNHQIVLSIWTNHVWCARVGDPGSTHDVTAIRKEFLAMVPDGCRVIADSGCSGKTALEKKTLAVDNNLDDDDVKLLKAEAKSRQEQFNKRLKLHHCMTKKFTNGVDKAKKCIDAIVVLTQHAIEDTSIYGEPLPTI